MPATNVPRQTAWDLRKAWERAGNQLPEGMCGAEWKTSTQECITQRCARRATGQRNDTSFPSTRSAYTLRKLLKGLVVGPLDKNDAEMWFACPTLYDKALKAAYSEKTGYERVFTTKLTPYQTRRFSNEELDAKMLSTKKVPKKSEGTEYLSQHLDAMAKHASQKEIVV